jgi:hypothetical protein
MRAERRPLASKKTGLSVICYTSALKQAQTLRLLQDSEERRPFYGAPRYISEICQHPIVDGEVPYTFRHRRASERQKITPVETVARSVPMFRARGGIG